MSFLFQLLFWLAAILHLSAIVLDNPELRFFSKPLLMPLLIAWYFIETKQNRTPIHFIMMIGFVFSCAGDVFLMETTEDKAELYFLLGLVSFLITHVLYIISFTKEVAGTKGELLLKKKPFLALPVIALAGALIALVFNRIEPAMQIPVIVYASVITVMVIMAINRHKKVSAQSFQLTIIGALLFMFSDSLIALNKFYFNGTLWNASLLIMLTYITGQFLIAKGTVKTT
ncbi:MAG: lysoplasmalogenase [Chitinophagales bacterium]|nr:lysoplasmalogenase [Chitinophagales bacterium]